MGMLETGLGESGTRSTRCVQQFRIVFKRMFGCDDITRITEPTPLPSPADQVTNLVSLAAAYADQGCDVSEASVILDRVCKQLKNDSTDSLCINDDLNRVRWLLSQAPERLWFSRTIWVYFLAAYEFVILGLWIGFIVWHHSFHGSVIDGTPWSLLRTIYISAVTGSIAATSFALYGLYTHMSWRNMAPSFVPWYLIRPVVGGIMGAFIGLIAELVTTGIGTNGTKADIITIGVAFLAGSNEKFAAQMIDRFTTKITGGSDKAPSQKPTAK